MKQFWSLKAIDITPRVDRQLTPEDRLAGNKVNESMRFTGERYEVAVPWKHDRLHLKSNRQMAEKIHEYRLMQSQQTTELEA